MAQSKKEFEVLDEFEEIAQKIVKKYPDIFYNVDIDEVRCVAVTNKPRPSGKDGFWDVMAVKQPIRMDCKYGWYIVVHLSDWDGLEDRHKKLLVADALCAIPNDDDNEGKVEHPDYKDYAVMLRTFGVDYLTKDEVPDILNEDIEWVSQ